MELFEYQKEGINFILGKENCYLCDEPGLGKTVQAIVSAIHPPYTDVIICPPFLCLNWQNEIKQWLNADSHVIKKSSDRINFKRISIVPDSLIHSPKISSQFHNVKFSSLIIDEAHRFKTIDAKRTKALFQIAKSARKIVALSGTPMPNRPMELYTMIRLLDWNVINKMSYHDFGLRYCGAYHNGFGWDYSGATRLPELANKLKGSFMLRRRKTEVLKELPEKIVQIIELDPTSKEKVFIEREQKEFKAFLKDRNFESISQADATEALGRLSVERKDIAFIKVTKIKALIDEILVNPKQKLLVFGYHNEPLKCLYNLCEEYKPLLIQGDTPKEKRNIMVNIFQTEPESRLLIGNYLACGVGLTLTAADRVLFLEPSWVPAENEQAIDRTHRIGQKNSVLAQFVVFRGSLDEMILKSNFKKLDRIHKTLNQ